MNSELEIIRKEMFVAYLSYYTATWTDRGKSQTISIRTTGPSARNSNPGPAEYEGRVLGRSPTEGTRLRFDKKKSTTLHSWRVVIASWEKRHYELKVRLVGDCKVIFS
jgi:hypothetical protein